MKRQLASLIVLLGGTTALAADDAWISTDDAVKKRETTTPVLVVFAKEDGEALKAIKTVLETKRLEKQVKAFGITRVDPGDEVEARKLGIPVEKNDALVAIDGFGAVSGRHEKGFTADSVSKVMKTAEDATTKKKKVQKTLDNAVKKGEAALKSEDTRTACEQFLAVLEHKTTIPCSAVETASKRIDELNAKGQQLLSESRTAISKNDFSTATKKLNEARANYPTPEVTAEAKKVSDELATAINNQQRGGGR